MTDQDPRMQLQQREKPPKMSGILQTHVPPTTVHASIQTDVCVDGPLTTNCMMNQYGTNVVVGTVYALPYGLSGIVHHVSFHPVSGAIPVSADIYVITGAGDITPTCLFTFQLTRSILYPQQPNLYRHQRPSSST